MNSFLILTASAMLSNKYTGPLYYTYLLMTVTHEGMNKRALNKINNSLIEACKNGDGFVITYREYSFNSNYTLSTTTSLWNRNKVSTYHDKDEYGNVKVFKYSDIFK